MKHIFLNKRITLIVGLLTIILGHTSHVFGQSMSERYAEVGRYDIKMISSMVLQPAWVKASTVTSTPPFYFDIIRSVTTEEQLYSGEVLSLNNRLGGTRGFDPSDGNYKSAVLADLGAPAEAFDGGGNTTKALVYADTDDDKTTYQSSSALLDFGSNNGCTTIHKAFLYWTGAKGSPVTYGAYPGTKHSKSYDGGPAGVVDMTTRTTCLMKTPLYHDIYQTVNGTIVGPEGTDRYTCVADVTALLQGGLSGIVTVANVQSETNDTGAASGWSLIVIFTPPNCPPRTIKIWDGNVDEGNNISMTFTAAEKPASGNTVSYLGFGGLDTEDLAATLDCDLADAQNSKITFKSQTGSTVYLQPFTDGDQPGYHLTMEDGATLCNDARDGIVSSQLTTYDNDLGTNGNQVARIPNIKYTCGYDAHHLKLPAGSMGANSTTATLTLPDEQLGGSSAFMAYVAIETAQAFLKMDISSNSDSVELDNNVTYTITVKNTGPLASKSGAYVLDTLIKSLDYVGNVQYLDKNGAAFTPPSTEEVSNEGLDDNEYVKFYLPAIAAGDGSNASDSVRIKFDVKVKPISRTDIWSYGCNVSIYNRASLIFEGEDGSDIKVGSNTSAGCSGQGLYYVTPIKSDTLLNTVAATHEYSDDYTSEVIDAGSSHLFIIPTLEVVLTQQLADLGMSANLSLYEFYKDGSLVEPTDYFLQDEPEQTYYAIGDIGGGCIDEFEYVITVAKLPKYNPDSVVVTPPDFFGDDSGSFELKAYDGTPGYSFVVENSSNTIVYNTNSTSIDVSGTPLGKTFKVAGLPADTYTFTIQDQSVGALPISGNVVIDEPESIELTKNGPSEVCKKDIFTLTAISSNATEFVWFELPNETTPVSTSNQLVTSIDDNDINSIFKTYRVYACNGAMSNSADFDVTGLPTPTVQKFQNDSGCNEFDLQDLSVKEQYNMSPTEYALTYHTNNPSSATDNSYLIAPSQYMIKKKQDVWARMSNDICYSTVQIEVYIKSMEECYPITISDFFSPDGDGYNDKWEIDGLEMYDNPTIIVYDRYGKQVFKGGKDDVLEPYGWDGTYLGNTLPSGDYWYQMNFSEIEPKVGHFTLKRKKE